MISNFVVRVREITLLDEDGFFARGGEHIHFGAVDDDIVDLVALGSAESIVHLRDQIRVDRMAAV